MATVHDVAAAIIERLGRVDDMKLQKLLFLTQGWGLAWRGKPIFDEDIEAWEKGPVVDRVYQMYKNHRFFPISRPAVGDPANLSDEEQNVVAAVLERYGDLSGRKLSALTHDNEAWAAAYGRRHQPVRSREVIDTDELVRSLRRGKAQEPLGDAGTEELRRFFESLPGLKVTRR